MTSDIDPVIVQFLRDGIDNIPAMIDLLWPGLPEYEKTTKRNKLHGRLRMMEKYGEVEKYDRKLSDKGQWCTQWRLTQ